MYANALYEELIRLGACSSKQTCRSNEMLFATGEGWKVGPFQGGGVSIEIYRVQDAAIAKVLIDRCGKTYAQSPRVPVSIVVYSNAHIDNLHPGTPSIVMKKRFS